MKNKQKIYLDLLKIIAIFLVIFNHLPGYILYQHSTGLFKTWGYMFITMLTRINVPLFIMISGSLLLSKEVSISSLFKKRVFRIGTVILIFNTISYFLQKEPPHSLLDWFIRMVSCGIEGSYWFLYEYLGMLIMLPFFKPIANNFKRNEFWYFLFFHFLISTLFPIINYELQTKYCVTFSPKIDLPLMQAKFIFYLFVGYYLDNILDIRSINKKKIFILVLCSITGIIISCGLTYHQGITSEFTQEFVQLFDYVCAITVFVIVKYIFSQKKNLKEKLKICISKTASLVFGIYLLDPLIKKLLYNQFENLLKPLFPVIIVSFLWCITSMLIGGTIIYIFKKIPCVKRIL